MTQPDHRSEAEKHAHDPALFRKLHGKAGDSALLANWPVWADKRQLPPTDDWRTWLIMAGRGFGKTRAGAEWVRSIAESQKDARIALVAATEREARAVMVEGESGILAISPPATRPQFEPSKGRLIWRTGAEAMIFSGENPDRLRGPQHHYAWCDELAKWAYPQATWDILAMGLRLGDDPKVLATTTPRPIGLLRDLVKRGDTITVRGATRDNRFLPDRFIDAVEAEYGGTRLGRQELDGELIEEVEGALWSRALIEQCRVREAPEFRRIVIGVDPPAGKGPGADACGIVAVGLGVDGKAYVIEDATVSGLGPEGWAGAVANAAARLGADRVIAEANNGGAMVESVLRAVHAGLPMRLVHASHGKVTRAEPVAALYEGGRAFHLGAFPELEDQLAGLQMGGDYAGPGRSPDRADALVWAMMDCPR